MQNTVMYCLNKKVENEFLVSISSLHRTNPDVRCIVYHMSDIDHNELNDKITRYNPNLNFQLVCVNYEDVDLADYDTSKYDEKTAKSMVVRLYALDQLLDLGVTDRIVYIDCDTVIQKDISEMFTVNLNGNWIAAAPEMFDMNNPTASELYKNTVRLYEHRIKLNPRYFNSGVMVIDLEKVGKNRFVPEFKNTSALSVFPDQDILNFLGNPYAVMPLSFNAMADFHLWRFREVAQSLSHRKNMEDSFILHFAGVTKPWEIRGEDEENCDLYKVMVPYDKYYEAAIFVKDVLDDNFLKNVEKNYFDNKMTSDMCRIIFRKRIAK